MTAWEEVLAMCRARLARARQAVAMSRNARHLAVLRREVKRRKAAAK